MRIALVGLLLMACRTQIVPSVEAPADFAGVDPRLIPDMTARCTAGFFGDLTDVISQAVDNCFRTDPYGEGCAEKASGVTIGLDHAAGYLTFDYTTQADGTHTLEGSFSVLSGGEGQRVFFASGIPGSLDFDDSLRLFIVQRSLAPGCVPRP